MNLFIFLAATMAFTLIFGRFLEKIRIPWVFSALFLGLFLSLHNPFPEITSSETFQFLADLGMYFLLFIIGLEINIREIFKQRKFIFSLSLSIIISETILGSIFIHYVFGINWGIAILTASSFSTVGEAILVPILNEFKLIKTKFGQVLLGVATLDDIVELTTIVATTIVLGYSVGHSGVSISKNFIYLGALFLIPLILNTFKEKIPRLKFQEMPPRFLFGTMTLLAFIGIGSFIESAALGAIFAGLAIKNLLDGNNIKQFKSIVNTVTYGFFVLIFFLKVGIEVNINYLFTAPLLIIAVLLITNSTKIFTSYLVGRSNLGTKKSLLLGIGLSAKFSTSIVIITMLYNQGIIPAELYSVLIGAMVASKFIIPVAFAILIQRWNIEFQQSK